MMWRNGGAKIAPLLLGLVKIKMRLISMSTNVNSYYLTRLEKAILKHTYKQKV
jgi:hypothetical protein